MNILILTKYPVLGPSSRYRFYQFLPALAERGHRFRIFPFFTEAYLVRLFEGKGASPAYVLNRGLARLTHCLFRSRYDLVWIEGELVPYLPAGLERLLQRFLPRKRVYEFDDANWLRYEGKALLTGKFEKILGSAAGVIVGNRFLENFVRGVNDRVMVIPTVVDWPKYAAADPPLEGMTIGWIGSQQTCFYLEQVFPALEILAKRFPIKLKVVGAQIRAEGFEVETAAWSAEQEVDLIQSIDMGIMPLESDPWSKGKCGLKLIQYLAAGVPAVASPVGVNTHFIEDSRGGYLARDTDEWVYALGKLLENKALRKQLGENGRSWVQAEMTVSAQADRLIGFLESIAGG